MGTVSKMRTAATAARTAISSTYHRVWMKWLAPIKKLVNTGSAMPANMGSSWGITIRKMISTAATATQSRILGYSVALLMRLCIRCSF